jgi:hypothetical protein
VEVAVKYERIGELGSKAAIFSPQTEVKRLSRRERIERLAPFIRTEYLSPEARKSLRADNSPLALAFGDPVLREDGLSDDTLGEGIAYFGLSEQKAHRLLCDCHYSGTMTGKMVASRLRSMAEPGLFERLRQWATGRSA